ncbi:hypothetical protein [Fusibacter sp. 3D3]|nr:hypothetical protein [Fusibacter sp. 3D3]GAU77113.1 hypothetical protein F3D3_1712 [Fusibacter sp. 3D3]
MGFIKQIKRYRHTLFSGRVPMALIIFQGDAIIYKSLSMGF